MTPLQKLPKNVGDLGKFNIAQGFKKLPKVQKIAKSGHTGWEDQKNPLTITARYDSSVILINAYCVQF